MAEDKDFRQRVQRIGALVDEIESIADPATRASTRQLVQLIMEFHGTGLDRMLEILADGGETGMGFIEQLGQDSTVSSLLVLYGLHPDALETRVAKAIERLEPKLRTRWRANRVAWHCRWCGTDPGHSRSPYLRFNDQGAPCHGRRRDL